MKVKQLIEVLQQEIKENPNILEKEVTCYDFKTSKAYKTPNKPTFVGFDDNYLDIVFNYEE